jgi:hypothetical protein
MKQRHLILSQDSHGRYRCLCGATWREGEQRPCTSRGRLVAPETSHLPGETHLTLDPERRIIEV